MSLVFCLLCLGFGLYETFFFGHCIMVMYNQEFFVGFFPLGFPRVNCYVPCDCVSFNDPIYVVIVKNVLNDNVDRTYAMASYKT